MILLLCADDVNRTLVLGPTGNAATPGVLALLARIHKAWGVLLNCIQSDLGGTAGEGIDFPATKPYQCVFFWLVVGSWSGNCNLTSLSISLVYCST
jgi:hypothetical protein